MTKTPDFLMQAKTLELVGGLFGWLWLLGSLVGLSWIIAAIFSDASWLLGLAILFGSQLSRSVADGFNRAAQKVGRDGVAAGQIVVDAKGQAYRATSMPFTRASLEDAFSSADTIVDRYAALLKRSTMSPYFSEDELPASKENVKRALLVVAAVRRGNGHISDDEVNVYKTAYSRLSFVISSEHTQFLDSSLSPIESGGGVANLDDTQFRDALRDFASAHRGRDTAQELREGATLPREFDTRFASLLSTYLQSAV